jgi:hypothetical protein
MSNKAAPRAESSGQTRVGKSARKEVRSDLPDRVVKPAPYTGPLSLAQVDAAVRAVMRAREK